MPTGATIGSVRAVSETDQQSRRRGWDVRRPWRTDRLPAIVNQTGAVKILGVDKATLNRWLQPDSGPRLKAPWGGFGPDRTYMITPLRLNGDGPPVWVREDVERFAEEIGPRRVWERSRQSTA